MADCPTELELERFLEGASPTEERVRVDSHVEACGTCSTWLREAEEDESVLTGLRRAHASGSHASGSSALTAEELGVLAEEPALARYRIVRRLGAGGMGVVYEAEQQNPKRSVALKVLAASFVSDRALQLFEREAQVLGRLQHPSIAQILEAGTYTSHGEPRPFFAMELIDGRPLTEFARQQDLGLRQRIELFALVCDAVQHAHQMGVVHRDLKPANVLVTREGKPKVLDFGVARIFDAEEGGQTAHTQASEIVGTLPYISPEQLSGDALAVDTRTDVYALGVTLFELLAGRAPFKVGTRSVAEAIRMIEVQQPELLGGIDPRLSGDLEVIAQKALEKDKDRRYESAAALAEDLRRFLRYEPISARPPSAVYQFQRLARRHRAVVAGLGLTFVALVVGLGATTWQARRAMAAEDSALAQTERAREAERVAQDQARRAAAAEREAQERAATVQESNAFFQALIGFDSDDPGGVTRPGRTTLRELVHDAGQRLDRQPFSDPLTESTLRVAIGNAQRRFGDGTSAVEVLQRALELREGALGPDHRIIAQTLNTLGVALSAEGRVEEALAAWERALTIYRDHGSLEPEMEATTQGNIAMTLIGRGEHAQAEQFLHESLAIHREQLGEDSLHVANDLGHLAHLRRAQDRHDEAIVLLEEAVAIARRTSQLGHLHAMTAMGNLAALLVGALRYAEAEPVLRERVEWGERALGIHAETGYAHRDLARLELALNKEDGALESTARAIEIFEELEAGGARSLESLHLLGRVQLQAGLRAEGEATLERAFAAIEASEVSNRWPQLGCMVDLGLLWVADGDPQRGRAMLADAVARLRAQTLPYGPDAVRAFDGLARVQLILEPASPQIEILHRSAMQLAEQFTMRADAQWVALAYGGYGRFLSARGRAREAAAAFRRAWTATQELGEGRAAEAAALRAELASALRAANELEALEELLLSELAQPGAEDRSARHLELLEGVAGAVLDQGRTDEALEWGRAALDLAQELGGARSVPAAEARAFLGAVLVDAGACAEALPYFEQSGETLESRRPETLRAARLQASHGSCLAILGRQPEAEPLLLEALEVLGGLVSDGHPTARRVLESTAQLYEGWGREAEAREFRLRAGAG